MCCHRDIASEIESLRPKRFRYRNLPPLHKIAKRGRQKDAPDDRSFRRGPLGRPRARGVAARRERRPVRSRGRAGAPRVRGRDARRRSVRPRARDRRSRRTTRPRRHPRRTPSDRPARWWGPWSERGPSFWSRRRCGLRAVKPAGARSSCARRWPSSAWATGRAEAASARVCARVTGDPSKPGFRCICLEQCDRRRPGPPSDRPPYGATGPRRCGSPRAGVAAAPSGTAG
jgi:hypothetical protein